MLKILSRMPNQDVHIVTKLPPGKYSTSKIEIREIGEQIRHLREYENAIIVFDDILGSSISRVIDQFSLEDDITISIVIIYHNPILIYRKELHGITVIKTFFLTER